MSLWSRIANAFQPERLDRTLQDEMRVHWEEARGRGRSEEELRRAFGGLLRMRERSHDVKVLGWLEAVVADVKFGVRQLRKNRVASGAAILSLALAIGASSGAFRLIDAVLLRPLPVADPGHLYYLAYTFLDQAGQPQEADAFSYPLFQRLSEAAKGQAHLLAISYSSPVEISYGSGGEEEKVYQQYVSGNTFSVLGLNPALGRLLRPSDDEKPGAHPVAVLTYDYWVSRFGRDPQAVGRTFHFGDQIYQIVGVGPPGFTGTETGAITGIFIPAMMNQRNVVEDGWEWLRIWVRPQTGHGIRAAGERLQASFSGRLRERIRDWDSAAPRQRVDAYLATRLKFHSAAAGASRTREEYGRALVILGVLVALVLLIACVNVANLRTAQAAARSREMALRVSIGAGRLRLLQLVLLESAILAGAATLLGGVFAWWSAPWVASMINPPDNPLRLVLPADWRVLGFTAALAILVTLFFGLAPALRASSVKPVSSLQGGEPVHGRRPLSYALIAAQVAFCLVVNFIAGLFVVTLDRLTSQPTGFSSDRILLLDTSVTGKKKLSVEYWNQAADHLRAMPNVQAVAVCSWALMNGNAWTNSIHIPGQPPDAYEPYFLSVSPGFLSTMRIPLLEGRDFARRDVAGSSEKGHESPGVAIVNEAFARRYFGGRSPLGRFFERGTGKDVSVRQEIVGYIKDVRYQSLREAMAPVVFLPRKEDNWGTFAVRVSLPDPGPMAPLLRAGVSSVKSFHVTSTNTQKELVEQWSIRERLLAALSLFFAALALLLAGVGLYGVLHYTVVRRTREIGVRMALGARAQHVIINVTAVLSLVILAGAAVGLAVGLASERLLDSLLFSVHTTEIKIILVPLAGLLLAALLAALPPVFRAIRIDPARALRCE